MNCLYHIKDSTGRRECGDPATHRNFTGARWFYLCEFHAHKVQQDTHGRSRPTPLVETILDQSSTRPKSKTPKPRPQTRDPKSDSPPANFLEQLRRFRNHLASQSDNGSV